MTSAGQIGTSTEKALRGKSRRSLDLIEAMAEIA
jgi:hypothetical protein